MKKASERFISATNVLADTSNSVMSDSMKLEEVSKGVAASLDNASESLQQIVNAMNELTVAAGEISNNVSKAASISNEAMERAQLTNDVIRRLGESSQNIGEITPNYAIGEFAQDSRREGRRRT